MSTSCKCWGERSWNAITCTHVGFSLAWVSSSSLQPRPKAPKSAPPWLLSSICSNDFDLWVPSDNSLVCRDFTGETSASPLQVESRCHWSFFLACLISAPLLMTLQAGCPLRQANPLKQRLPREDSPCCREGQTKQIIIACYAGSQEHKGPQTGWTPALSKGAFQQLLASKVWRTGALLSVWVLCFVSSWSFLPPPPKGGAFSSSLSSFHPFPPFLFFPPLCLQT